MESLSPSIPPSTHSTQATPTIKNKKVVKKKKPVTLPPFAVVADDSKPVLFDNIELSPEYVCYSMRNR